jgi:hypothetical protein
MTTRTSDPNSYLRVFCLPEPDQEVFKLQLSIQPGWPTDACQSHRLFRRSRSVFLHFSEIGFAIRFVVFKARPITRSCRLGYRTSRIGTPFLTLYFLKPQSEPETSFRPAYNSTRDQEDIKESIVASVLTFAAIACALARCAVNSGASVIIGVIRIRCKTWL